MAITIAVPPAGLPITPFQDLAVTVVANAPALKRATVSVNFPGYGRTEVVHDGFDFLPPYAASLRVPYTSGAGTGFQYTIRRDLGWIDGPIVHVLAFDTAGGEAYV